MDRLYCGGVRYRRPVPAFYADAEQSLPLRAFMKIMVEHDHATFVLMSIVDGGFHLIVAGKKLRSRSYRQTAVNRCTIQSDILSVVGACSPAPSFALRVNEVYR